MGVIFIDEVRAVTKKRLAIFVVAGIVMFMLAFAILYSEQDTGDLVVIAAVRGYLSVEQKEGLTQQLNAYASLEEGRQVVLKAFEFPAVSGGTASGDTAKLLNQLLEEIRNGGSDLMLLDTYVFDMMGDERLFADLSAKYPGDAAVTRKYLYAVGGKAFAGAQQLWNLPEVYFALRNESLGIVNKNAQTLEKYAVQSELLDRIARNKTP